MRIAVVQTAYLGDLILTTPLLRELHRLRPDARLGVVTTPLGGEVYRLLPYVDEIWVQRKRPTLASFGETWRTGRALRRAGLDVVIAAHRSHRSGWLVRASGAELTIGFEDAPGAWAYGRRIPRNPQQHAVRRYLGLAAPLGGGGDSALPRPELFFSEQAVRRVDRLLVAEGIEPSEALLCLAPGSVWPTKRWSPEGFAAVATAAAANGLRPLLVGSGSERTLCAEVLRRSAPHTRSLAGRTGIEELAALLARSRGLVCNDSGSGHVASAVGTPVVSVFGPTVPRSGLTPFGVPHRIVELDGLACRPCGRHGATRCPLGHFRCMREIEPQRVLEQMEAVIRSGEQVA